LREGIERSVREAGQAAGAGSEVGHLAARFQPVKARTSRLIAAREAAERGASKAAQRSGTSLKDYLLGSAAGDPASAFGMALASSAARNRLPSAMAAGNYSLSEALRTGAASPALARTMELALEPDMEDWGDLVKALRTKKPRKDDR
jgi:hypothetical protein